MSNPFRPDPVRDAIARYRQRFPGADAALLGDAVNAALFKHLERALVQADIGMQDEGLDADARRRVISCALYGSVDEEAAVRRHREAAERCKEIATADLSKARILGAFQ